MPIKKRKKKKAPPKPVGRPIRYPLGTQCKRCDKVRGINTGTYRTGKPESWYKGVCATCYSTMVKLNHKLIGMVQCRRCRKPAAHDYCRACKEKYNK